MTDPSDRKRPLASILITNHNYGRYLGAALEGALSQSYPEVEVVVVDDGSTDCSRAVIERYGERVRPIFQDRRGQPGALNAAFEACRGEYVFPCDADDVFVPSKLERLVEIFRRLPDIGWVYHELDYIGPDGAALPLEALGDQADVDALTARRSRYAGLTPLDLRQTFREGRRLPYTCPAMSGLSFRRDALSAVLPMPESIGIASDEFPKFAALALFPGAHVGEALALQRLHGANAATLKRKDRAGDAVRHLRTAYHLRRRFEGVGPSTDRWFANALGTLVATAGVRAAFAVPEARAYIADYFGPGTWLSQSPRVVLGILRASGRPAAHG